MTNNMIIDRSVMQQWVAEKLELSKVKEKLVLLGLDEETVKENLREFRKLSCANKQFWGFVFLCGGAGLGFISCVLTLTNPVPELDYLILYGLTSIAITLICMGLYCVFE